MNCRGRISPETAIRLSKAFGSTPGVWLGLDCDLAQAEKKSSQIKVQRLEQKRLPS